MTRGDRACITIPCIRSPIQIRRVTCTAMQGHVGDCTVQYQRTIGSWLNRFVDVKTRKRPDQYEYRRPKAVEAKIRVSKFRLYDLVWDIDFPFPLFSFAKLAPT